MVYRFEVVIVMVRDDEELSIVRKTHSLYHTVIMHVVESWTRLYRKDGWKIRSITEQNFEFIQGEDWYEHG